MNRISIIAAIARGTPGLCPDFEAMCAWLAGEPMTWLDDNEARDNSKAADDEHRMMQRAECDDYHGMERSPS